MNYTSGKTIEQSSKHKTGTSNTWPPGMLILKKTNGANGTPGRESSSHGTLPTIGSIRYDTTNKKNRGVTLSPRTKNSLKMLATGLIARSP